MRKMLFAAAIAAIAAPAMAQVGVSVNVGQPGFYGQINIGNVPQPPQVIYAQPVVIQPAPGYAEAPIYLRVPPGYEQNWARYCDQYRACGRPVYFVRDDWYNNVYVQHDRRDDDEDEHHSHGRGHGYGHGHGRDRGDD